jgi:N-methylhydantoinase B/oxoprolinase/acetone carboxylase alpha subunit
MGFRHGEGGDQHSIEHTERRVREEVAKWPDGTYEAEVLIDHDTRAPGTSGSMWPAPCRATN